MGSDSTSTPAFPQCLNVNLCSNFHVVYVQQLSGDFQYLETDPFKTANLFSEIVVTVQILDGK